MAGHSDFDHPHDDIFTGRDRDPADRWPDVDQERVKRVQAIMKAHPKHFEDLHLVHHFPDQTTGETE